MKKQCHVYSVEYYSVIMFSKMNKLWVPAIIWLNLRDFMLSERSQSQNSMCFHWNAVLITQSSGGRGHNHVCPKLGVGLRCDENEK